MSGKLKYFEFLHPWILFSALNSHRRPNNSTSSYYLSLKLGVATTLKTGSRTRSMLFYLFSIFFLKDFALYWLNQLTKLCSLCSIAFLEKQNTNVKISLDHLFLFVIHLPASTSWNIKKLKLSTNRKMKSLKKLLNKENKKK